MVQVLGRSPLLFIALISSGPAWAQPKQIAPPEEHRVDFTARHVELDPEPGSLLLSGNVVVRSERFQLTSEAMSLSRSPRGVHVEGGGRLAFCACLAPPVSFGFSEADLAPPSDALLTSATLRVGGVPVFWSPYLWLRSPMRPGVVPPTLEFRGEEGFLVGSGVHLPFVVAETRTATFDAELAAYLRGGARIQGRVATTGAQARVTWDHFRDSSVEVVGSFARQTRSSAAFSGRVDWLRGARALVAPADLDVVALRSDRARVGVVRAQRGVLGFSLQSDAPRGSELSELGVFSPTLDFGLGVPVGPHARFGVDGMTRGGSQQAGDFSESSVGAEFSGVLALGPLQAEVLVRGRGEALTVPTATSLWARSEVRSRLGLPLARRFRNWVHTVSPLLEAAWGEQHHEHSGQAAGLVPASGDVVRSQLSALAGLETALGDPQARSAAELRAAAGVVGPASDPRPVLSAQARVDMGLVRLTARSELLFEQSAGEILLRAEAGDADSVRLKGRIDGVFSQLARARAALWEEGWALAGTPSLDRSGWSTGARVAVLWARRIETEVGADYDASARRWLSGSVAVGYRHPCGCLSLSLWGSRRLGRQGHDIAGTLELVP